MKGEVVNSHMRQSHTPRRSDCKQIVIILKSDTATSLEAILESRPFACQTNE